jgi:hypothetical protein
VSVLGTRSPEPERSCLVTLGACKLRTLRVGDCRGCFSSLWGLQEVSIDVERDADEMFERLAALPSVGRRGDGILEIAVGPTTHLLASKTGNLTLYAVAATLAHPPARQA